MQFEANFAVKISAHVSTINIAQLLTEKSKIKKKFACYAIN